MSELKCLRDIIGGRPTKIPKYDYKSNCRVPNSFQTIYPQQVFDFLIKLSFFMHQYHFHKHPKMFFGPNLQVDVVLFEGILTFYSPEVKNAQRTSQREAKSQTISLLGGFPDTPLLYTMPFMKYLARRFPLLMF